MWFLLLSSLSFAGNETSKETIVQDVDYVEVTKGTPAPFNGFLLSNESVALIIAKHNEELSLVESKYRFDVKNIEANNKLQYDLLKLKYDSEVVMYREMIDVRDQQLQRNAKKDVLQKWGAYGAFIVGAATSVAIFYSVNHN